MASLNKAHLRDLLQKGFKYGCLQCLKAIKGEEAPDFCERCGCDLFLDFQEELEPTVDEFDYDRYYG